VILSSGTPIATSVMWPMVACFARPLFPSVARGAPMESRAKLLGHPIHQMLIPLPLGLLSGSVAFDVVHRLTDDDT
jgi:hypothetical protein